MNNTPQQDNNTLLQSVEDSDNNSTAGGKHQRHRHDTLHLSNRLVARQSSSTRPTSVFPHPPAQQRLML